MIFCTIAGHNYLPKALHLAITTRHHHPSAKFVLCQPERYAHPQALLSSAFDLVLCSGDLNYPKLDRFAFTHNLTEFATAIKARLLLKLLDRYPEEDNVVYLDPDIAVYSHFTEVEELLHRCDILVTPHHLHDEETDEGIARNMFRTFRSGVFNLGFLAVRRSVATVSFLHWWDSKLERFCWMDRARGLFVDQKWIDIALCLFPLTILTHPGYNVANWNISQRAITEIGEQFMVRELQLRFIHFSKFDVSSGADEITRYASKSTDPVHRICNTYKEALESLGKNLCDPCEWTFERFESGERISPEVRRYARHFPSLLAKIDNPFSLSNEYFLSRLDTAHRRLI